MVVSIIETFADELSSSDSNVLCNLIVILFVVIKSLDSDSIKICNYISKYSNIHIYICEHD